MIGKDILRQHAVIWPAMLMAAGLELPKTVFAHGFLTVGGKKMSKTNLTGISPDLLIDTFGTDGYRYHFLREGTFGQDGAFSWEAMAARYNADLANDLGNLVSRSLAMTTNYFEAVGPAARRADRAGARAMGGWQEGGRRAGPQRARALDPAGRSGRGVRVGEGDQPLHRRHDSLEAGQGSGAAGTPGNGHPHDLRGDPSDLDPDLARDARRLQADPGAAGQSSRSTPGR